MKPFNCSLPVLSLCFSLSYLLRQYTGLHNSTVKQQMPHPIMLFYTGSARPKFAYVTNLVPPETRRVTYKLHCQWRSCNRFSILPVLYTQDTFVPFSNFEVCSFAHHFLFVSFFLSVLLWKEFNSHSFVLTFHFSRSLGSPPDFFYPAMVGCWIHVNVSCSACIYSIPLVISLNDKLRLAHRRQHSAGSAFQFHYTLLRLGISSFSLILVIHK